MVSVADAPGTKVHGIPHRIRSLAVPGVAGAGDPQLRRPLEQGGEVFQGHDALRSGQIEAHNTPIQIGMGHLHRLGVLLPIRSLRPNAHHAAQDAHVKSGALLQALFPPCQHGLYRSGLTQPLAGMQLGGETDLRVGQVLAVQQADQLSGHPGQAVPVLHHGHGQIKHLQILVHAAALGAAANILQIARQCLAGHRNALLLCQLKQRLRRHGAIQMQMQVELWKLCMQHRILLFFCGCPSAVYIYHSSPCYPPPPSSVKEIFFLDFWQKWQQILFRFV